MATIKSLDSNELEKYIQAKIESFLVQAGEKVKEVIKDYIEERFYGMYEPEFYDRTYQLLESVTCTDVKKIGSTYQLEVYLDTENVDYGSWNINGYSEYIDPEIIFKSASEGWHGNIQTDGRFMEEAKEDLQEGISYNLFDDFKKYLQFKGFNVIVK